MDTEEHSIPGQESTCCSEKLLEDANDLVDSLCSVQPKSLVIKPSKLDTGPALLNGSEDEPDQLSVSERKYSLELGSVGTEDEPAIHVSSKFNGNGACVGLLAEGDCTGEVTKGIGLESLQAAPENSHLPELKNTEDIQSRVSGLCLIDEKRKDEVVSNDLIPKVSDLKEPLRSEGDLSNWSTYGQNPSNESLLSISAGDMLTKGDLHPTLSCVNVCNENEGEGGPVNAVDQFPEPLHSSPTHQLTVSTVLCGKKNDVSLEDSIGGNHFASRNLEHKARGEPHFTEVRVPEASRQEELHSLGPIYSAEPTDQTSSLCAMVADVEASDNLVSHCESRVDGLVEALNSVSVDDVTCDEDTVGKEDCGGGGDIGAVEFSGNQSTVRRSSRASKHITKERVRCCRKGPKKSAKSADNETLNFLVSAVRNRRSCLSRAARASSWGLTNCISDNPVKETGAEVQILESAKSAGRKKKQTKVQASATSPASKGKNHGSSGIIRLKVKLGNEELNNAKRFNVAMDAKDSVLCQENSMVDIQLAEKGTESGLFCGNDGRNLSDKEVQHSGSSAEDRLMNSGTSPDSEVINQIPNPQTTLDDASPAASTASPAVSTARRKKGNKKDKATKPNESGVLDRVSGPSNADSEVGDGNRICCSIDMGLESVNLRHTKECLPPIEAQGGKKSKCSKGKVKNKSKSSDNVDNTGRSRKFKGDKWTLTNKQPIVDGGSSNQVVIKERNTEAGNLGTHACSRADTCNDKISEDVSSLAVSLGGGGKPPIHPPNAWVCCDSCHKWRCIPAKLADIIGDRNCRWTCKDNQDEAFADCLVPQEKSNEEINAELDISEEEDGRVAPFDGECNGMRRETALAQASWTLIRSNIFLHRSPKTQTVDEIMVCHCKVSQDGKLGCGDECLNRMLNIECVQGSCPCGDLCSNQQFQRRNYARLNWFRSGKKGYGLQALEDIAEGKFLIEYVGEVLDLQSYESRQREYASKSHKHFYFMTLNGNEVIDACTKGNLGRFINHSCEPNCRTEKWIVNGEICIGLFALRDIKKGEEVTFDYNYVRVFGAAAKKCYCGATRCRGCIGGDLQHNDLIVQSDSDQEFPEPVVMYEGGDISIWGEGILTKSSSMVFADKKNTVTDVQHSLRIFPDDSNVGNRVEGFATVGDAPISENIVVDSANAAMIDSHPSENSEALPVEIVSSAMFKRPDSSVPDKMIIDSSSLSVGPKIQLSHADVFRGRYILPESRPRMKVSRSKLVKNRKSSYGVATDNDASVPNMSEVIDNKNNKSMEISPIHDCETVEAKLGVLLDSTGGICKQKDAFKGFLRVLALTSVSGDGSDRATIQSIRDLSMILDAILKTKSRTVLTDIINKNGLQMLHLMLKKCRGNFNKIPILRKLLKVFEFLAEKKILTLELINKGPSRAAVKSFRESILDLTDHPDKKVHQRARSFRDRWIPKPSRKYNSMDQGDRNLEKERGPNSRFSGRDSKMLENCGPPSSCTGGISCSTTRKRKSRWDERAEPGTHHDDHNQEPGDAHIPHGENNKHCMIDDDEEDDDAPPPGFGLPSFEPRPPSIVTCSRMVPISDDMYPGPLKCPSQVPSAYLPERFNSSLAVAYGIPLHTVQEFGTPQAAANGDGWVIAPGMVFHPFPPLPLSPRKPGNGDSSQYCVGNGMDVRKKGVVLRATSNSRVEEGVATTSTTWAGNTIPPSSCGNCVQDEREPYYQRRRDLYPGRDPRVQRRNEGGYRGNYMEDDGGRVVGPNKI